MTAPSLAWGELHLFKLPDDRHLYGREFELLPAGTMLAASVRLNGLAGVLAEVGDDNIARVDADALPVVYPTRGTEMSEIELYESDILEGFRFRQLQDAQG